MTREKLREALIEFAHSCNCTLGQMIFTSAGVAMLAAATFAMPIVYLVVLIAAVSLAWTFRHDLRS